MKNKLLFKQSLVIAVLAFFMMMPGKGYGTNLINENIQSWTSHASYGTWNQSITAGAVSMASCIVAPTGAASGTGTTGYVQMQAANGILALPALTSVGTVEFRIHAGGAGRTLKLQSYNGTTWVDLTTFTIGVTGATFTYNVNSGSSTTLRLATPSAAVYVHDIIVADYIVAPTTQAQDITFSTVTSSGMKIDWTNGNGTSRAVFVKETTGTITNPVDGTTYTASTDWNSTGTQLGASGYYCVYNGAGTTATLTNLVAGTAYYVQVFEYNGTGATSKYYTATAVLNPNSQTTSASGNTAPTVTTQAVTSIGTATATGNGNITATGGVNPTDRGVCWGLASGSDPDISGSYSHSTESGSFSTGAFTGNIISLTAGTQYKVRAYATNSQGTGYGSVVTFYSQSTEPSGHAGSFDATAASQTQIDLTFSAASTITDADGYLILQKTGSAPTGTPSDATGYSIGGGIGDGTVAANITNAADVAKSITGLTAGTHYFFTLFPYNWDGSNAATYNYKTDGSVPVADATTDAPLNSTSIVVVPTFQVSAGNIASTATSSGVAVDVFKFKISDLGSGDTKATKVTTVKITKTGTAVLNTTVADAELWNGGTKITTATTTVNLNDITFTVASGNLDVDDNTSTELTLKVWLSSTVTDNSTLIFSVPQTTHGFIADASGSTFASDFGATVTGNTMTVTVAATKLLFTTVPTAVASNTNFTVAIAATDANNNTDIDAAGTVTLAKNTGSGNVTSVAGLAQSLSSGVYSWSDVQNDATGGNTFDLQCTHTTLTQATSGTITISSYSVGDFGFTAASGNWVTTANWKQWDGSGWNTTPSGVPAITNNVFILAGKTCTVEASGKNCKNITIEATGKLYTANTTMSGPRYVNVGGNITCNGTIGNGAGSDDVISFNISGGITSTISGSGVFTANRVRRNNSTGILNLIIAMDIELRYNGDALYNATSAPDATQAFNVTINADKFANLTGNTGTPTAGYALKSVDAGTIYGKLTVTGTLTNGGTASSLVIKSNATGTGSLITSSAPNATVERYITGASNAWHQISAPVTAQAIASGFVPSLVSTTEDFFTWYETGGVWVNYKNTTTAPTWSTANGSTNFVQGKGYLVAYSDVATNNPKTFTGTLNAGTINFPMTVSGTGTGTFAKTNLAGNPYPSSIDWKNPSWVKTNIKIDSGGGHNIYIYNQTANNYGAYNDVLGSNYGTNGASRYIAPMQGFIVEATAAGNLSMTDAVRVHSSQAWLKSGNEGFRLKVTAPENKGSDEISFEFGHSSSLGGAAKWNSFVATAPSLSTPKSGTEYCISFLETVTNETVIPVTFKAGIDGQYTLAANLEELQQAHIYLVDNKLGKTQNLSDNPVYTFAASTTDEPNRFKLTFNSVGIDEPAATETLHAYVSGGNLYISGTSLQAEIRVTNMLGQVVLRGKTNGNTLTSLNINNLQNGVYVVSLVSGSKVVSTKIVVSK